MLKSLPGVVIIVKHVIQVPRIDARFLGGTRVYGHNVESSPRVNILGSWISRRSVLGAYLIILVMLGVLGGALLGFIDLSFFFIFFTSRFRIG